MGSNYSQLVFQPNELSSYSENQLEGLEWYTDEHQDTKVNIPLIFIQWKGRQGEEAYFTILYSSGNVEDLGQKIKWVKDLSNSLNVNVLCYEYTGFGINRSSKPSEKHCYEDIMAAYHYLVYYKKIPSHKIILYGKSLGSGPTIHLASILYQHDTGNKTSITKTFGRKISLKRNSEILFKGVGGIILQSPITSVLDLYSEHSTISFSDMFENKKKIGKIKSRFLIIHGTKDEIVPIKHSQRLKKEIENGNGNIWKFLELEGAGHHNMETNYADDLLENFLQFVNALTPSEYLQHKQKIQSIVPIEFSSSPLQIIYNWLKSINMEKYCELFLAQGYYDMEVISTINESDLNLIGIKDLEDRKIILESIMKMNSKYSIDIDNENNQNNQTGDNNQINQNNQTVDNNQNNQNNQINIIDENIDIQKKRNERMKYHSDLKILFSKTNSFNETLQKDNIDEILNQENKINNELSNNNCHELSNINDLDESSMIEKYWEKIGDMIENLSIEKNSSFNKKEVNNNNSGDTFEQSIINSQNELINKLKEEIILKNEIIEKLSRELEIANEKIKFYENKNKLENDPYKVIEDIIENQKNYEEIEKDLKELIEITPL